MHIDELLELKTIRSIASRYRSLAFTINNHNEQEREENRMVINYKRLNDNTLDNSYKST